MCLARILRLVHIKDFKVENNSLVSVAAGTGEMNYDRIIRFMKERKPYIHATLENTVPGKMPWHRANTFRDYGRSAMWDRFFDLDNVVWRTIDKIGKIFLLNLLWLICSLPVFTIGASTTALMYTSMKLSDNEGYWHQNFFSSFKENFKQATALFFIYLAAGAFLAGDFLLGGRAGNSFGS